MLPGGASTHLEIVTAGVCGMQFESLCVMLCCISSYSSYANAQSATFNSPLRNVSLREVTQINRPLPGLVCEQIPKFFVNRHVPCVPFAFHRLPSHHHGSDQTSISNVNGD